MFMYANKPPKEIRPIDRSELIYFTKRLMNFIKYYEKYLVIDDASKQKIEELKKYVSILSIERYDLLLKDTSIIEDDLSVSDEWIPKVPIDLLSDENLPF